VSQLGLSVGEPERPDKAELSWAIVAPNGNELAAGPAGVTGVRCRVTVPAAVSVGTVNGSPRPPVEVWHRHDQHRRSACGRDGRRDPCG
jgi:hypothetical protein